MPQLRPSEDKQINKDFLKRKRKSQLTGTENHELKPPWKIVWGKKILILAEELLEAQGGKPEK